MRKELKDAIKLARRFLKKERDANMAIFCIRDFSELEEVGLKDLAWSLFQNYCTVGEVGWFLDELEKSLGEP